MRNNERYLAFLQPLLERFSRTSESLFNLFYFTFSTLVLDVQSKSCVHSSPDAGDPDDLCVLHGGRGGWVVGGTMNPSPSTDRQYRDFNKVFLYKAGTYTAGTRYLRGWY